MDGGRRDNRDWRGGERSGSSYASLASGPAPSYSARNEPPPPRGRGTYRGGNNNNNNNNKSDDRSVSSYEYRGGRGGGRGRGRSSFRRKGGRGGGGGDRFSSNNNDRYSSTQTMDERPKPLPSPKDDESDNSGYESGEISLSPKPVVPPPSRDDYPSNDRFEDEFGRNRRERDDVGRYGDGYGDSRRGSGLMDDRPPFDNRDGGRGGRFSGRGGRGRGGFGRGGRSDFAGGRGRSDEERSITDREFLPRDVDLPRDIPSRDFPPRERDLSPRDRDLPPARDRDFPPRERDLPPPRGRDLPPRERDLPPREREMMLREREPLPRDRDFPPRDITLREEPRDVPIRIIPPEDLPPRERMMRDGPSIPMHPRDEDRFVKRPVVASNSYSSILAETEQRPIATADDRFTKRRRDDADFRSIDHEDKRPRDDRLGRDSIILSNESRPVGLRDGPRTAQLNTFPDDRRPPSFRADRPPIRDDRDFRAPNPAFQEEPRGVFASRDIRESQRPTFRPRDEPERLDSTPAIRRNTFSEEQKMDGGPPYASSPFQRPDIHGDLDRDRGFRNNSMFDGDVRPPPRSMIDGPPGPIERRGLSPIPPNVNPHGQGASEDFPTGPGDNPSYGERAQFPGRSGLASGPREGRGGRGFRGARGGRGRPDFGRPGPADFDRGAAPPGWNGPERNAAPYAAEVESNSWTKREEEMPVPQHSWVGEPPRVSGYASLADQVPSFASMALSREAGGEQETAVGPNDGSTVKPKVEEAPPAPRPLSPPPVGSPSRVMKALTRLAELEASMEYAFAKHMLLVKRRTELQAQYKVLENLPVGMEAIQEDLEKLQASLTI